MLKKKKKIRNPHSVRRIVYKTKSSFKYYKYYNHVPSTCTHLPRITQAFKNAATILFITRDESILASTRRPSTFLSARSRRAAAAAVSQRNGGGGVENLRATRACMAIELATYLWPLAIACVRSLRGAVYTRR